MPPPPSGAAPPVHARWRAWWFKLGEHAVALVLALVLAEAGARLFLRLPARTPPGWLNLKVSVPEEQAPGMASCLLPGSEAVTVYPTVGGEALEVRYKINSEGFRDRIYARERAPGTFRMALIGDSVTFGFGIPEEDTLAKSLEALFAQRVGPGRVEVMNCGLYSYNATQQAAHLAYRVANFRPDLVLFITTATDASGYGLATDLDELATWQLRWTERLGLTWGRFDPAKASSRAQRRMLAWRRRSALVDYLANSTYLWLNAGVTAERYLDDWAAGSPGRAAVGAAYARALALGERLGFELRVAVYPVLDRLHDYPLAPVHEAVAELCAERDIVFLDLLPALAGREARSLFAHAHDNHPNGTANRLVAERLYAELEPRVAQALGESSELAQE